MINNLEIFLTYQNIFLIANWGVVPFWLLLIFLPSHYVTKFLVQSVLAPLILASGYAFIAYKIYLEGNIFEGFNLYLGIEDLYTVYANENFLIIFWLHFLSISLFIGSWIARDAQRFFIPKFLTGISLIMTYFSGPIGLIIYWFIRIFFSKKISFYE